MAWLHDREPSCLLSLALNGALAQIQCECVILLVGGECLVPIQSGLEA